MSVSVPLRAERPDVTRFNLRRGEQYLGWISRYADGTWRWHRSSGEKSSRAYPTPQEAARAWLGDDARAAVLALLPATPTVQSA